MKARYCLRCLRSKKPVLCSPPLHVSRQVENVTAVTSLGRARSHDGASTASFVGCRFRWWQLAGLAASDARPRRGFFVVASCAAGKRRLRHLQDSKKSPPYLSSRKLSRAISFMKDCQAMYPHLTTGSPQEMLSRH